MEPLYRFDAELTEIVPIGLVPEGVRLDAHFEGTVTAGALEGMHVRGVDYLLLRADGVGVIDAYELDLVRDGKKTCRLVLNAHKLDYFDADNVRLVLVV